MNERMTKRDTDGQAMMDCQKCEADWTGKHCKPMVDCTALYCRNRLKDRLAAYEDTGLTPELVREVAEFAVWVHENGMDKIREWVKAEEEKRLGVMPCKAGDTLYYAPESYALCGYDSEPIFVKEVHWYNGTVVVECYLDPDTNVSVITEDFGKTVFFTREEAEKALKEYKQK